MAYSDITVELLNYDEDLMRRSIPVKEYEATVTGISDLTHDIRLLEIELEQPLQFWAGQYVDLTIPDAGITRSYSMANPPSEQTRLRFIIKLYPQGAFSALLDGGLKVGAAHDRERPIWHLLPARRTPGADVADRRRLRHVAAMVDPAGPRGKRRAAAGALLLWRAEPGAICSTWMNSRP